MRLVVSQPALQISAGVHASEQANSGWKQSAACILFCSIPIHSTRLHSTSLHAIPFQLTMYMSVKFQLSQVQSNRTTCCQASTPHHKWRHQLSHTAHAHAPSLPAIDLLQHCRRATLRRGGCGDVTTRGSVYDTFAHGASHAKVIAPTSWSQSRCRPAAV